MAFSSAHQVHIRAALNVWGNASGLVFVEVPPGEGAIRFSMFDMSGLLNSSGNQLSGYAYFPSMYWFTDANGDPTDYYIRHDAIGGDVFLNSNLFGSSGSLVAPGVRGFSLLLHEIGHALGFEHPFEGTYTINPNRDSGIFTVMSYNRSRSTVELGSLDEEAIEYIYGPDSADLDAEFDAALNAIIINAPSTDTWLLPAWHGAHLLTGGAGDDSLLGDNGDDTLIGGDGDDWLRGGEGDDMLYDGPGNDTIEGDFGNDTLIVPADVTGIEIALTWGGGQITRQNGEVDELVWIETVQVVGNEGVRITGSAATETLIGGDGDDTIQSMGGLDSINGGAGNDELYASEFALTYVEGGAGDDTLIGGFGNDTLDGGGGADVIDGGDGYDIASYASADRSVRVDLQNPAISFNDAAGDMFISIEEFQTGDGIDQLRGDAGDNIFRTGGVSDRLYGRAGDDMLFGEAGADAFYGGLGADIMTGGDDAGRRDRYIYFNAAESGVGDGNRDVITDFVAGEDRIELSRIDADITQGFKQGFEFIGDAAFTGTGGELRYEQAGGNTIVQADRDGDGAADFEIELTGTMDLTESDFLI
ncbi:M10 family metallopeptidase C-terminal domain-containing protein [Thalassococcus lentus]|uniref:M10 family metallopeptidase C-terminal domain-containing protein n=1 Tax=Thalassococcus lentus TaxID=1210524 RepID=A0ABT4XS14_9RHOB|nr:M10 family metallopeptidase C-terminal domain-containing protein [Thalassococcus lentus]MDA7424685.1 M10 family metallopeptidase C-terminal domain-containing protein [Thalassococcus lentus]